MAGFVSTLAATLVSIAATWFFAWLYYQRAGNELRQEAQELRRLTGLILVGLQNAGLVEVRWDKVGKPIGVNITLRPQAGGVTLTAPTATISTSDGINPPS